MAGTISHKGRVISVDQSETKLEILSTAACASCHAAGLCTSFESSKKEITVPTDASLDCKVGEEVEVLLSPSMGMKAVWISYAVPLGILLILVVSLSFTKLHELLVAGIALAGMGVYYLAVYLLRDKLAEKYVFSIRK